METSEFDYNLPEELIAQSPLKDRSKSRLMVLDKNTGEISHKTFTNIIDYLNEDDVLVINDTKVLPARIIGTKEDTNAKIEILLLRDLGDNTWECLTRPQKRVKVGSVIIFNDKLKARCLELKEEGITIYKFEVNGIFLEILNEIGQMPLPPYIHEKLADKDRYQTIYAKNLGSAAAPTAGLHFTKEILDELKKKGVKIIPITLHVGLGTFRPVTEDDPLKHKMHKEYYEIKEESAKMLNEAIENKKRIVAVGTTSVRTLESAIHSDNKFYPECKETGIFIYPGYEFKAVDALITNFHLPKSTLIMLVSAFASKEIILNAYNEAVKEKYRFFSFGDAMFIK